MTFTTFKLFESNWDLLWLKIAMRLAKNSRHFVVQLQVKPLRRARTHFPALVHIFSALFAGYVFIGSLYCLCPL